MAKTIVIQSKIRLMTKHCLSAFSNSVGHSIAMTRTKMEDCLFIRSCHYIRLMLVMSSAEDVTNTEH